ncbi:MAG: 30S ribosomal protein S9 [Desulfobacterales bacterium]|jgi:small subunit ribosomal protein S9|nr:30S ribosomal protein S9 [Desulfobacterales bacterium]MCD4778794.1 30S ribosomal protein S9 [Desulfobacterales bacterium]MDL1983586.1 30S ribosomal protein S9 [Deltaproteobacteria bacterium]
MNTENIYYATGKRKTAIARTWLKPGKGEIIINNRPVNDYFKIPSAKILMMQPLVLTNTLGSYDIKVRVLGGGISGQAGAIRHGITKALIDIDPDLRQILKKAGFVKRDPRVKERKKYGQKGARARFQFSKR